MSGVSIQIPGAAFTKKVAGMMLPKRDRLLGEYKLGVDFATSAINHANAAAPLTVVGTPTYGATFGATIKGASAGGFDTGITPPRDATVIVVRKRINSAGANMLIVGNQLGNGNSFGVGAGGNIMGFYDGDNTTPAKSRFYSNETNAANIAAETDAPVTANWFFEAGTSFWGAAEKLYTYSGGVQAVTTSSTVGYGWDNKVLIGTSAGFGVWTCDVLHVGIYDTPLTADEIDDAYVSLKAFYAALGATID